MTLEMIKTEKLHEGIILGEKRGIAQGEYNKAVETARKMIAKGLSVSDICEYTGLSADEVHLLKNQ